MDKTHIYPAGSLIVFTEGSYSDYGIIDIVVAAKEIKLRDVMQEFKDSFVPKVQYDTPRSDGFVSWLIVQGYAYSATCSTVHLGDYNSLSLDD